MDFPSDNLKKGAIAVIIGGVLILAVTFIIPVLGVLIPLILAGAAVIVVYLFFKKKF